MRRKKHSKGGYSKKLVGMCGLVCSECPAFIATQRNDMKLRQQVAKTWSKEFGVTIKPTDINCDGCITKTDRVISHCTTCEIRKCGKERAIVCCAYCNDYACDQLNSFIAMIPEARLVLEEIRATLKKASVPKRHKRN